MKKTTKLAVAAFCAVGAAGVLGGSSFAADSSEMEIDLQDMSTGTLVCKYSPSSSEKLCDSAKYGVYDVANKTLTLGPNLSDTQYIYFGGGKTEEITIKQNASNVNLRNISGLTNISKLIIDLGSSNTLKMNGSISNSTTDIVMKSGKIEIAPSFAFTGGNITFDGGSIVADAMYGKNIFVNNNAELNFGRIVSNESFIVNNGSVNASEYGISYKTKFELNGGHITTYQIYGDGDVLIKKGTLVVDGSGIFIGGNMKVDGGEISINDKSTEHNGFGIRTGNEKDLVINGGNIAINGFDWGISNQGGRVMFNGGTTVLKNSIHHLLWILHAKDPKNDIVFGNNMGIKEKNIVVFYADDNTGIVVNDGGVGEIATITAGESYTRINEYATNEKKDYSWIWFENWAKEEEWTKDIYNIARGYVSCLLDNSFQIYNLTDFQAYHGLLKDKSKNKTLTADETKKMKACYTQYFKESDDKNQEGLIIEGSGEEKKSDKKDNKDKTVPGAPNTGLFGENKAFAVAAAVIVAPVLGIAVYLVIAAKKRADRKVSFKKR